MRSVERKMPLMAKESEALAKQIEEAIDDIPVGAGVSAAQANRLRQLCDLDDGTVRIVINRRQGNETTCTPAWYAIERGKQELLPYLLGSNLQSIPMAYENGWERLNLVQALAAAEGGSARTDATFEGVFGCLDHGNPNVADQLWRIAIGLIERQDLKPTAMLSNVMHAARLLSYGGVPAGGVAEYQRVLESTVLLHSQQTWPIVACFSGSTLAPASVIGRMLDNGLSASHQVLGMPLLHHAATGSSDLIDMLIERGADLSATCPAETCSRPYNLEMRDFSVADCTAADMAEAVTRPDYANMLRAAAAKSAINKAITRLSTAALNTKN